MSNERFTVQVDAIGNFSNVISEVGKFRSQLQSLKLPDKLTAKLEKGFDNVESKVAHFQSLLSKGITTKGDFSKLISSAHSAETAISGLKEDINSIGNKDIQIAVANSADIQKAEAALKKVLNMEEQLASFGTSKGKGSFGEKEVADMQKLANTSEGLRKRFKDVTDAIKTGNIDQASNAIERLIAHAQKYQAIAEKNGKDTSKWDSTIKWAQGAQTQIDGLVTKANQAKTAFQQMQVNKFDQMKSSVNEIASGFNNAANGAKQYINATTEAASRTNQLNEQVGHLRTQANYFFGLQNMGRLIARGIREAAESVRDLDKAMTDTAVVTEFSVHDMWNMLPEYTALANKLGATTQGAYETMTLYFQQGLNKQETFEIGEETMKMARIAGLDYAQTTNMMTAALRGFNMELNQTSAKRVNDVYSELAAITASDTRELGLAMERTASIAHSANMDFGNTTAFLAQMIETTREAPENLGTAMKTIIARFQELKQNPYEISEVEGEEVDFNRVDKALKSIGVDLMDNRDKFRDLDDVFMDISSKWDGLSQTQQRYIATMAAGSRQQSRFLAMVQNYDRLKELTDAAANSEGAATVQFNKTLDSYEAKVNKLKNAWQAFTMSLANNQAVKLGVDTLQKIITFGNKIIETFGKIGGVFGETGKGLAEMAAAFGLGALGFKGLRSGANAGLGLLARMTNANAANANKMFTNGFGSTGEDRAGLVATKITNPIVSAIDRVIAAIQKEPLKDNEYINQKSRSDLVKNRQDNLYGLMKNSRMTGPVTSDKKFNIKNVKANLKGLTKEEQQAIYQRTPVLRKALEKSYGDAYSKLNLSKESNKAIQKHLKQDVAQQIQTQSKSVNDAITDAIDPYTVAKEIGGKTGDELINSIDQRLASKANTDALQKRWSDLADKMVSKGKIKAHEKDSWIKNQRRASESKQMAKENSVAPMMIEKLEGKMISFSSATNTAGQAVMGLGMALNSLGLTGLGSMVMTVGNGIMGLGMAAQGASLAIGKMGAALKAIGVTGIASALTNPILLGITALSGLAVAGIAIAKKHRDNIKQIQKDSKKILSKYEKDITDTTRNINQLLDSKDTFAKLSQGVDENNNNISLGTAEYSDYLQIVNQVAKMHPELVKGYNAHGQAILKNNNAVEKAIELERIRQHDAEKAFADVDALDKLIAGRNTTKRWAVGEATETKSKQKGRRKSHLGAESQLDIDTKTAIESIQKLEKGDKVLTNLEKHFNLSTGALTNMTDEGLKFIQNYGDSALDYINDTYDEKGKKAKEKLTNIQNDIAKVGKDITGLEEVTEPIYKSLSTYASQHKLFDNIPDEFKEAAERGLKEISKLRLDENGKKITGEAMQQMATDLGNKLSNLGGHAEQYQKLIDNVQKAQDQYVENLNKEDYLKDDRVTQAISQLQMWADEARAIYESSGKESDLIMAETFENQLATIKNFTDEGAAILSEGFNTFSDIISAANGAFDDFSKQIEGGDYYTGANAFKQIFDEIQDGIDNVGRGSQTWWKGAEKLLGEGNKNIKEGNFKAAEAQVKALEPMFQEGQAGVEAFLDHVQQKQSETVDSIKGKNGLASTISDLIEVTDTDFQLHFKDLSGDQLSDLADKLGMSDQMLASMLNKAKQFYDIDFSNIDLLDKALRTADSSVFNEAQKGKKDVYTKESTFVAEAEAQGNTPAEIKSLKEQLTNKGIKLVKDAREITSSDMKGYVEGMGIKTGQQFIDKFSQLGFSREDIKTLYDNYSGQIQQLQGKNDESFNQMYTDYVNSLDELTIDPDGQQLSEQQQTNSILSQIYSLMGGNKNGGTDELEKVRGKKGEYDTEFDHFALGQNKNGTALTDQQYTAVRQKLMQEKSQNEAIIKSLNDKITQVSGKEKKQVQEQIDAYTEANKYLDTYLKKGEEKKRQLDEEKTKQDELNKSKEEESSKTPKDTSQEDKTTKAKQDLQALKDAQDALKNNSINISEAFGLKEGEINKSALQFSNIINTLKASGVEVESLGQKLQGLDFQKLSNADLGKLISELGLTKEQAEAINALNPELNVTAKADTTEADAAIDEIDKETAEEKVINVVTSVTNTVKGEVDKVSQQPQKAPKESKKDTTYTVDVKGQEKVDQLQTKITELNNLVNKGGTYNLNVSGAGKIQKAAKAAKDLSNSKESKTISVKTGKADTSSVKAAKASISNTTAKIKVGANVSKALSAAETARKKIDSKKATINVSTSVKGKNVDIYVTKHVKTTGDGGPSTGGYITPNGVLYRARGGIAEYPGYPKKGTDRIPAYLTPGEYVQNRDAVNYFGIDFMRRINRKDLSGALQSFGSAARGTLKGRLGPKGQGGLTLTGEKGYEIAWIPSEGRSMILGAEGPQMIDLPPDTVIYDHFESERILKKQEPIDAGSHPVSGNGGGPRSGKSTTKGKKGKKSKKKKKKKKKGKKNKDTNKGTINNFSIEEVVRFNLEPQLSRLTEQIADRTKEIEKILTGIGNTYDDIVGSANKQVDALNQVKEKNKALYNSYANQLADFRGQKGSVSWTDDKGNSHDKTINIGDWVDANGVINQSKIAALGSRAEQEATFNFLNNTVKGLVDGMTNAEKAMKDAQQQIDELGQKISEAFYQWKNELTEIYDLTQRINNEVSFTDRFTSQVELELSKLSSGFGETAKAIKNIRSVLTRNNATIKEQIENQQQMIAARQRELNAAISYEDEIAQRQKYEASNFGGNTAIKNATVAWARDQETIAMKALSYVTDVFKDIDGSVKYNIDWAKFNAEQDQSPINKETYDKIKTYLDDLNNAATEFNNAIKEQTDFIKQTYESLKEYQENIVDFEDTLIKGVEEEIENETENAKKISSSISDALKDLLDEVKRKLDERRKQEDNAKTERDISQKQQRLAALRADTAGGHQVEIAQLEKEIADAQQDYGRTLEDQLLDRLQQQADKASEQRERQIELAETSNEISAANNKELVDSWLREPEKYKEQIKAAWLEANGYDEKGEAGQYVLRNQFESDFAELVTAVEQTNFADHFNTLTADTNSLVALLQELTNGQLGREDELSHKLDDVNALYDVTDRNTTSILTEIQKGNIADLRAKGVDAKTLKSMGYNASTLIKTGGYTADELQKAGFTAQEVFDAGITDVGTLKNAGYSAGEIKAAGANNIADFKNANFEAKDLIDLFGLKELVDADYGIKDLKDAGVSAKTLREEMGYGIDQLKGIYSLQELKPAYTASEFGAANISYADAKAAGYTRPELQYVPQYAAFVKNEIAAEAARAAAAAREAEYQRKIAAAASNGKTSAKELKEVEKVAQAAGHGARTWMPALAATAGLTWKEILKAAKGTWNKDRLASSFSGDTFIKAYNSVYGSGQYKKHAGKGTPYSYKTGGLADYTGPAWLDGTPSKPELVLNAADTKNFLALKDVLSRAVHSSNSISNSYGDATYEININVDHLNNDYDVDRVAERVKKIIVKDAGYRNVTQVRNFR